MASRGLGTLTISLVAETAGFVQGMDKSERATAKWRRQVQKDVRQASKEAQARLKGISVAVAGAVAGISAMTVVGLRNVDAQTKMARSLDTTYDSVTALQLAFGEAGIDNFEASMNRLNRRLGAAELGRGSALKAVEELNLNLQELAGMDADQRIAAIADRISEVADNSQQAARFAQDLGFEQREAAAFFMQGGDAIRGYRKEVEDFGLALSAIETARVEEANDEFAKLGRASTMVQQRLAVGLAPVITQVSKHITDSFREASGTMQDDIGDAVKSVTLGMADIVDSSATVLEVIDNNPMSAQFGVLGWLLLGPKGALIGAAIGATFDIIEEGLARVGVGISQEEDAARRLINVQEQIAQQEQIIAKAREIGHEDNSRFITEAQDQLAELLALESSLQTEVEASTEAQDKYNELLNRGTDRASGFAGALRGLAGSLRDIDWDSSNPPEGGGSGGGLGGLLGDGGIDEALAKRRDAIRQSFETEKQTVLRIFGEQQEEIKALREAGAISQMETDNLKMQSEQAMFEKLQEMRERDLQRQQDYENARKALILGGAEQLFGSMAELTEQFAGKQNALYKIMFAAQKSAAIAQSIVAIQQGIALAAANPWPVNLGAMASVAAATAGIVGNIQSVALTGMAHDGIDSVPKTGTWLLEKGERVMTSETSKKLDKKLDGGSGVVVNLYEDASKAGQVQQGQRDDGTTEVNVFVSDIMSNGPRAKAMQRAYGLRRQGT